jgi:hypothetical protein
MRTIRGVCSCASRTGPRRCSSYAQYAGRLFVRIAKGPATAFELFDGTMISQDEAAIRIVAGSTFTQGVTLELIGFGDEVLRTVELGPGDQTLELRP